MSKLMICENRTKQFISGLRREKASMQYGLSDSYSPFSEFVHSYDKSEGLNGLHLGDCPSLIHTLPTDRRVITSLVMISIVRAHSNNPFLVLFVTKNSDRECVFHTAYSNKGKLEYSGESFLRSFGVQHTIIGHFMDRGNKYYSVYEVAENSDSSTVPGLWLTPNEVVTYSLIAPRIDQQVSQFVTTKGEGITMLYANGKFIPPPRVFYTTERDKRTWSITIGDAQYAVVSSFFDILEEEEENTKVREMCRLIGTFARVTRVIYWAECDPTLYTLENSRDRCSYNAVTVPKDKCFFLSDHYGYLTSESQDVVAIVRDKMFIFE